jgi:hypothetical protein
MVRHPTSSSINCSYSLHYPFHYFIVGIGRRLDHIEDVYCIVQYEIPRAFVGMGRRLDHIEDVYCIVLFTI